MGGNCGGSPATGTNQFTYTTNQIFDDCTVSATFIPLAQYNLTVTDLGDLAKDHLMTGAIRREGVEAKTKRQSDLSARPLDDWERLLKPSSGWSDEEEQIRSRKFRYLTAKL
jgi:hypothetical protein